MGGCVATSYIADPPVRVLGQHGWMLPVKKLVVGPWVGSIGPPLVCTGRVVPSAGDALLALTGRVVPPVCDALRCSGLHARYTDVFNESIALADRPGKRESSARVDYVPALCTHRPSLLPIEWSGEVFGLRRRGRSAARDVVRSPLNLII
ncbi:hypothetical protein VNO80_33416 [Phaseolus coccineus]|uniref:Uncharacterized protein n=1 Tax=Phaseolus coccineus TaxID=3886 RepID=A0AAN9L108_PHACN